MFLHLEQDLQSLLAAIAKVIYNFLCLLFVFNFMMHRCIIAQSYSSENDVTPAALGALALYVTAPVL